MKIKKLNENKKLKEELNENHPIFKRISQDLDDIEFLCNDTYNWEEEDWNKLNLVRQTANLIIQYASDIKDALDEYQGD